MTPAPHTLEQINEIELSGDRPLFICDVDEVVVHFIRGLEDYLADNAMRLRPDSFALNGNIRWIESDEPVSVEDLRHHINRFFEQRTLHMDVIEGAVDGLCALSEHVDVIMLTNLPKAFRDDRIENLRGHGLEFPVIANEGAKGPAIRTLADQAEGPVFFIDDLPNYLQSAADHLPDIHLVHFMQDARFGKHLGSLDFVHLQTDNWSDVIDFALRTLEHHADRG